MKKKQKERLEAIKEEMQNCVLEKDSERAHIKADDLLCEALNVLGQNDLVELFTEVTRWYA